MRNFVVSGHYPSSDLVRGWCHPRRLQSTLSALSRTKRNRVYISWTQVKCKLRLTSRLQVVFKALIVLHTMMRNGATDNVLAYLSASEVLRLRNVSAGNWDGAYEISAFQGLA